MMKTTAAPIQRCACGKKAEPGPARQRGFEPEAVQRKSAGAERGFDEAAVHPGVLRPPSGGAPLPGPVRARMEAAFGHDFGNVRIHHGGGEAESIGALAYARGSHLHFAPGQYQPHTPAGQRILGHELAHVVQQRAGRVPHPGGPVPINTEPRLEAEADAAGAHAVAAGVASDQPAVVAGISPAAAQPTAPATIQRATLGRIAPVVASHASSVGARMSARIIASASIASSGPKRPHYANAAVQNRAGQQRQVSDTRKRLGAKRAGLARSVSSIPQAVAASPSSRMAEDLTDKFNRLPEVVRLTTKPRKPSPEADDVVDKALMNELDFTSRMSSNRITDDEYKSPSEGGEPVLPRERARFHLDAIKDAAKKHPESYAVRHGVQAPLKEAAIPHVNEADSTLPLKEAAEVAFNARNTALDLTRSLQSPQSRMLLEIRDDYHYGSGGRKDMAKFHQALKTEKGEEAPQTDEDFHRYLLKSYKSSNKEVDAAARKKEPEAQ